MKLARKIRNYALGVNVKLYKLQGGNESLSDREEGLGLDLGCLIPVKDKLQVGIVCKDLFSKLAGQLQIEEQARKSQTELGPDLTLGLAYLRERSTWAVDFSELITNPEFKLGVEYAVASNLKVRAGYKPGSLSVGLGIASGKFIFDYAYMTHELKDEQRLSVGLSF